jgi:hypothetical protein
MLWLMPQVGIAPKVHYVDEALTPWLHVLLELIASNCLDRKYDSQMAKSKDAERSLNVKLDWAGRSCHQRVDSLMMVIHLQTTAPVASV